MRIVKQKTTHRIAAPIALCLLAALCAASCGKDSERPTDKANAAPDEGANGARFSPSPPEYRETSSFYGERVDMTGGFRPIGNAGFGFAAAADREPAWLFGARAFAVSESASGMTLAERPSAHPKFAHTDDLAFAWISAERYARCLPDGSLLMSGGPFEELAIPSAFDPAGPVSLAASRGVVVVSGSDGKVAAYSADGGNLLWSASGRVGPLVAACGLALWARADGGLDVRSALDGASPAKAAVVGADLRTPPAIDGNSVFLALADGTVAALDARTLTTLWLSAPGMRIEYLVADSASVFAFGPDRVVAMDKASGAIARIGAVGLPCRPASVPVINYSAFYFAGTDGIVYGSVSSPSAAMGVSGGGTESVAGSVAGSVAESGAESGTESDKDVERTISLGLGKYLDQKPYPGVVAVFRPFVQGAPHEDEAAFTVFSYTAGSDSAPLDVSVRRSGSGEILIVIFDAEGKEIISNADEIGASDSFRHWFEPGARYFLAVGRRSPGPEDPAAMLYVGKPRL